MHGELKAPRKRVQISHACPECNKKFSAETDLIRHLKYAHDSGKKKKKQNNFV